MPKKITANEIYKLTKDILHSCYKGNLSPWFDHLSDNAVYLCNGSPTLFGGIAIKNYFKTRTENNFTNILHETYHPIVLSDTCGIIHGQCILCNYTSGNYSISKFTLVFQLINDEFKIILQQNSYDNTDNKSNSKNKSLEMNQDALKFVQALLLKKSSDLKINVKCGTKSVFIDPYAVLYITSRGKNTEFVCIDRIIQCNNSIKELEAILPDSFYKIHRSYIVNVKYIVSIKRFEVKLIPGTTLPIPEHKYKQIKSDITALVKKFSQKDEPTSF